MTAESLAEVVGVGLMVEVGVLLAVTVAVGVVVGSTEEGSDGLFNANAAAAITATATIAITAINNLFMNNSPSQLLHENMYLNTKR
jgi:hypothetical protein